MAKPLKDISKPQSFEDLMAALKAMYHFDFTRQQAGYIIVKLMGLQRRFKKNYAWDDFFNAQQRLDTTIRQLISKWSAENEEIPADEKSEQVNYTPDESNMDYVSNQLLMKDIYGESKRLNAIITETIDNFLRRECYQGDILKK